MRPESLKYLADMRDAADLIDEFTVNKTLHDLRADKLLRAGIYHEFTIIGEALSQLRAVDPATAAQISEHHRIIGFRNQIIHGYAKIDDEITWRIIETKLPILRRELAQLLP
ncbi:MAG TPA: HepT-like ribonuclease domain-containing protein [Phycisphaerae bacterium]|nr:HepT-like ribonuclease domain-containing protein [Phycisphaerae bacterium]